MCITNHLECLTAHKSAMKQKEHLSMKIILSSSQEHLNEFAAFVVCAKHFFDILRLFAYGYCNG